MKKPIHLYILAALSAIASVMRLYTVFFSKFDEAQYRSTFDGLNIDGMDDMVSDIIAVSKASIDFTTSPINKALALVLFALIVAVIFFLFKKANERASYIYIGYLFGTLIYSTYSFIGVNQISKAYQLPEELQQIYSTSGMGSYGFSVVLFLVYFGVTVFFLLRKPKSGPDMEQTSTDI